jgi:hypothetical protein
MAWGSRERSPAMADAANLMIAPPLQQEQG